MLISACIIDLIINGILVYYSKKTTDISTHTYTPADNKTIKDGLVRHNNTTATTDPKCRNEYVRSIYEDSEGNDTVSNHGPTEQEINDMNKSMESDDEIDSVEIVDI